MRVAGLYFRRIRQTFTKRLIWRKGDGSNWFQVLVRCLLNDRIGFCVIGATRWRAGRPFGGGFGGGRGGGGFGRGGDTIILREDVQKELDLSEKVIEDLRSTLEDLQQETRQSRGNFDFRNMSTEERDEAFAEMRQKSAAAAKKARKAITAKLSTKQKKRYAQLEVQYHVQQGNLTGALEAAGEDLSSSEQEKLNEALQSAREEIRRRTAELSRELYAEAMGKVSNANIEKMMGKPFAFEITRGRGQAGPGGQRGGRQQRGRNTAEDESDNRGNTRRTARPAGTNNNRRRRSE